MRRRFTADDAAVFGIGIGLADAAYTAWIVAQAECSAALSRWFEAEPHRRGEANLTYRAALDREEAAARDLERLISLAARPQAA
jgi:uncharacterized protein YeaO (DUF488 family)